MIILTVDNIDKYWQKFIIKILDSKYEHVKLIPIKDFEWGREYFVHDSSGVLLHYCEFIS